MHPEILSNQQTTCSKCGMKLEQRNPEDRTSTSRDDKAKSTPIREK